MDSSQLIPHALSIISRQHNWQDYRQYFISALFLSFSQKSGLHKLEGAHMLKRTPEGWWSRYGCVWIGAGGGGGGSFFIIILKFSECSDFEFSSRKIFYNRGPGFILLKIANRFASLISHSRAKS